MSKKFIPSELIEEILSRLPVKSLLRFRCVSKPWCSLIDDPCFVKLHLKQSIEINTNINLIERRGKLYPTDFDFLGKSEDLDHPFKYFNRKSSRVQVLGPCNGWLCLINSDEDFVLWNMSTRKYHFLPCIPVKHEGNYIDGLYGFGHDSINDDYKVLSNVRSKPEVNVYSLRTNAGTSVQLDFPYISIRGRQQMGMHSNGALHWMVTEGRKLPFLLIAFDLVIEKSRNVPLPDCIGNPPLPDSKGINVPLGVLRGCLCLAKTNENVCVDIWMMKVYGVKDSWTKLFSGAIGGVQSIVYLTPMRTDKVLFTHEVGGNNTLSL